MKLKFKWMALLIVPAVVAVACSNDDEDVKGPVDTNDLKSNAVITTDDGDQVLCTKIGYVSITYNSDNLATKINDITIRYDEGIIIDRYEGIEYKMSMNSKGFISKLTWSEKDSDGEESGKADFTYDASGHLTKIIVDGKDVEDTDDSYYKYRFTCDWTTTVTLNWNGDDIKSVKCSETENERETGDRNSSRISKTTDNYYVTDSRKNILGQYSYGFGEMIDGGILEELVYAGLLGKAPGNLPTEVTHEWSDEIDNSSYDSGSGDYYYSFKYNNDGTINCETLITNKGYTDNKYYSYTSARDSRSGIQSDIPTDIPELINHGSRRPHRHDIMRRH